MIESLRTLRPTRILIFIGLYLLLCYLSIAFIKSPGQVALMWPASGLALAYMLRYGLAWCLPLAATILIMHGLMDPLPALFIPFSILSNVVGAALAYLYVRSRHPDRLMSMQGGFTLVQAALLMSVAGGLIGVTGMRAAGMLDATSYWPGFVQWVLANVSGIICTGPAALLLTSWPARDPDTPQASDYSGKRSSSRRMRTN